MDAPSTEVAGMLTALWKQNSLSRESAVDPNGEAIVTMTTHGGGGASRAPDSGDSRG